MISWVNLLSIPTAIQGRRVFSSERLKGIDVFVCAAELGSFTAAAERLSLTSSAVSKGIARLESRLGIRLFERTTRRLALTDAGTAYYRTCTRVLADLEESELALHTEFFEPRGRIRIDLPASYGRMHVLPVFWGTASETAAQLAGPAKSGQAIAWVYLGITAALLLGIPLGTLAANGIGWRGAFWLLAGLSLLMAFAIAIYMPKVARTARVDFLKQARIFKEPLFLANVALSIIIFSAMFVAYAYLVDILERVVGVASAHVGWWMMGFGAIGLIGNWVGGKAVDHSPLKATALFVLLLAAGMAAVTPLASSGLLVCIALALWGIANTALYPICQVRVMNSVSHS